MYNNVIYSDSSDIVNLFNSYFNNIIDSLSDTLKTNSFDPNQYVSYITETISLNTVSCFEYSRIFASLKITFQNSNEMPVWLLSDYRDYLAPILSEITLANKKTLFSKRARILYIFWGGIVS